MEKHSTAKNETRKLKVIVTDTEETMLDAFFLNSDNSISDVMTLWTKKHDIPSSEVSFSFNDLPVSDKTVLSTLNDMGSLLELTVDRKITVEVTIYKSSDNSCHSLHVFPSLKPEEVHKPLRQLLHIGPSRIFRLRTHLAPLSYDKTLRENGICEYPHLIIDFVYDVTVINSWHGDAHELSLYASDSCGEMLDSGIDAEQRLLLGHVSINTSGDVADAFRPVGGDVYESYELQLSSQRLVYSVSENTITDHSVWPNEKLNYLNHGARQHQRFICGDYEVTEKNCFADLVIVDNAVIELDPIDVMLCVPLYSSQIVTLSNTACVRDLLISAAEEFHLSLDKIQLHCHGRLLNEYENSKLHEVGVRHGDQVKVISPTLHVKIHKDADVWEHTFTRTEVKFSDILFRMCKEKELDAIEASEGRLICVGCGRSLTMDEEEFQQIPISCCRVRSLELRHVHVKDTSTQPEKTYVAERQLDPVRKDVGTQFPLDEISQDQTDSSSILRLRLRQYRLRDVVYIGSFEDTLESIVTFLRRQNRLMCLKSIHTDDKRKLTNQSDWRRIKLRDCQLDQNQLLTVESISYDCFRIEVLSPSSQWPSCQVIWLKGRERSLEAIRWHLKANSSTVIDKSTMIFQLGTFYTSKDGRKCRSILSFNRTLKVGEFRDEDTGLEVSYVNSDYEFREMLFLGFGFRATPTHPPVLTLFKECKLFRLGNSSSDAGSWVEMQNSELRIGKFLMMLEGLLFDGDMFIQCSDGTFFDAVTGDVHADEDSLYDGFKNSRTQHSSHKTYYRIFMFLNADDKVPFFPIPADRYVGFYLRDGVEVKLEGSALTAVNFQTNGDLIWIRPLHVSSFQKKFTRCMRSEE